MDDAEVRRMRREILDDVGAILREELAADEWGRLLVEVIRGREGASLVSSIDVDELFGNEARVDEIFSGDGVRAILPVLANAVEALCALDQVDLDDVRGGTFVRMPDHRFAWLPSLVRAPSATLDRERDALIAQLRAKNEAFHERFGRPPGERMGLDLASEKATWAEPSRPSMRARATLIGTFAPKSRTWGWGTSNPHAPETVRRQAAILIDTIEERNLWELSTPVFPTDELTAWAIAGFVLDRSKGEAVVCVPEDGGLVFVLLRDAH